MTDSGGLWRSVALRNHGEGYARRYAEVFDVPVVNLMQVVVTKKSGLQIRAEKTENPLFYFLRIEG